MDSASAQLVSTIGTTMLNELRVQYARRHQFRTQGISVDGPAVTVSGVAAFGGARIGDTQLDRVRVHPGHHAGHRQRELDSRQARVQGAAWTRSSSPTRACAAISSSTPSRTIAAYLAAKSGANPFGYTTFQQLAGDPSAKYDSSFCGFFVQDDWQITSRAKLLFGVRYDLFDVPDARPFARQPVLADVQDGQEQLRAARGVLVGAGRVVADRPAGVDGHDVRAAAPRLLRQRDPEQRRPASPTPCRSRATSAGAPAFPASLASAPPGFTLPRQSINAVDPNFKTQSAWLTNIQIERALNQVLAVSAGYVNSIGRNLPVLVDINVVPTGQSLPDGRPVYSTAVSTATRADATFDHVNMFKSIGESTYNALHGHAHQADDARLDGAGHLHAGTRGPTTRRSPAPTSSAAATTAFPIRPTSTATGG